MQVAQNCLKGSGIHCRFLHFWGKGGGVLACFFGMGLLLSDGSRATIEEISIEKLTKPETTYNFGVADYHTYYITKQSILVHNACNNPSSPQALDRITGYTEHGVHSALSHDGHRVKPSAILDTVRNPSKITYDASRETFKYFGKKAIVVLNESGEVVTTFAKSRLYWRYPPAIRRNIMKIKFSENEISIIKMSLDKSSNQPIDNIDLFLANPDECSSKTIWYIIDSLTDLIGYDSLIGNIDALGKEADVIISKLLQFLAERGEI